ncbi:MAG: alpha-glucosidase [Alphaproteobacteria bacterium]|nr:alpha-glucosidase [Alphaproteobacteria bacterium]
MRRSLVVLLAACSTPAADGPADTGDTPGEVVGCDGAGAAPGWAVRTGDAVTVPVGAATLTITHLPDSVVRLSWVADGASPVVRDWLIPTPPVPVPVQVAGQGDTALVCGPDLVVSVDPVGRVQIRDADGVLLLDTPSDGAWGRTPQGEVQFNATVTATTAFHGLGEKAGPLNLRGRQWDLDNTDAYDASRGGWGPNADPLYLSVPLVIGVDDGRAWGLFTDTARRATVDLGVAEDTQWSMRTAGGTFDQYVLAGPRLPDVLRRFTALTGRAPLPPGWALGYHQSRWGYRPDSQVADLAATFRNLDLPADSVWLDIQAQDGFRSFTFDPVDFPDPEGLFAHLHTLGIHAVSIVDPGLKVDPAWPVFTAARDGGHLLTTASGAVYEGTAWPGTSAWPDFSRAATRSWWAGEIAAFAGRGVDAIWLDVNEPTTFPEGGGGTTVPDDVPIDGDGAGGTMADLHNAYGLLEARATVDGLRRARPDARPFVLSRAGTAGIQRYAAVWTGDAPSAWWSLQQQLPMLLNLGLSGVPFVGSDVGGYSGGASPELFARWMALGTISPFFRGHVTQGVPGQEPWAFGIEVTDISRQLLGRRQRLLPYLYSLADAAHRTGAPMLRPLAWELPAAPGVSRDDEAFLGPWLLVAPVVTEGATTREVYLPPGRWYEWASGAAWDGPVTVQRPVTLAALPTFVREGAIVPLGPVQPWVDAAAPEAFELALYPGPEPSRFTWYDDAGDGDPGVDHAALAITLTPDDAGATVQIIRETRDGVTGTRRPAPWLDLTVWRADGAVDGVTVDGVAVPAASAWPPEGAGWWRDPGALALRVRLPFPPADATIALAYDRALSDLRPPVTVPLTVHLPPGTSGTPYVATDASGWTHVPLAHDGDVATGTITVPRGEWYLYKYSRGDWCTVEKYPDCVEATDRYALGTPAPRDDTVYGWRDACDDACP